MDSHRFWKNVDYYDLRKMAKIGWLKCTKTRTEGIKYGTKMATDRS